jgi:hypothetical protein
MPGVLTLRKILRGLVTTVTDQACGGMCENKVFKNFIKHGYAEDDVS